jgi:hypothetical protein
MMATVSFHTIAESIPKLINDLKQIIPLELEKIVVWNTPGDIDDDYYPFCIVLLEENEKHFEIIKQHCERFLPCSVHVYLLSNITEYRKRDFLLNHVQFSEFPLENISGIAEKVAQIFGLKEEDAIFTLQEMEESDV